MTVPEHLAPLAKLTFSYTDEELKRLLQGLEPEGLAKLYEKTADLIRATHAVWQGLYETAIEQGLTPVAAGRYVRNNPTFRDLEAAHDDAYQRYLDRERWGADAKERVQTAVVECLALAPGALQPFSLAELREQVALDKTKEKWYDSDMAMTILIPEFAVEIPEGTTSWKIETACNPTTDELNHTPLVVNQATWERNKATTEKTFTDLLAKCHQLAGKTFRPNSPADVAQLLFEDLKLPVQRVNKKTGQASTDEDTLQALDAMGHKIAGAILDARSARSTLSQLEAWAPYAQAGSVQAKWNQQGTPMGRYSCEDPNLQSRVLEIRETVEAPSGWKLTSCDLGQGEYVSWASLSGDEVLGQAFKDGTDFHRRMYAEVRGAAPGVDLHNPDPRQAGKTINFALLYLMQPFVLAKRLGITTKQAQELIDGYAKRAPKAIDYREKILAEAVENGTISTKFGRLRHLPALRFASGPALHEVRKTAWHHHNSGTAAELLKIKQVKVHKALAKAGLSDKARFVLQMHDELIVMCRDDVVKDVEAIMLEKFEEPIKGFLPFKIDQRTGWNWKEISK